jgi:virginiamycin A acetyltransferase
MDLFKNRKRIIFNKRRLIMKLIITNIIKKISTKRKKYNIKTSSKIDIHSIIGEYTFVGDNFRITKTVIGRYCSIAPNVFIGQGEHKTSYISTSSLFLDNPYEEMTVESLTIGNDVWIGNNVVILRGVKIGNGAVIGASTVVTKDVDDFSIVVGNPQSVIKYRFSKEQIDLINKSSWWDHDYIKAKSILEELNLSIKKMQ